MMYAIQNMELRFSHARSGSLHENKHRLCALYIVLVKKHVHSQLGNCLMYTCSCMLTYENTYVIFCYLHIAASK